MSIAFKEWALVCEALGSGAQSIVLRKGGIAEGREGFRFQHPEFFLFPTLFHEQLAKTTLPPETAAPAGNGRIRISCWARVEWTARIEDLETARKLTPFHIWKASVVEERFRYDETPGLHLAFLRVYRLGAPWEFADAPAYGGCRSWVKLPEPPPDILLEPVLDEPDHAALDGKLRQTIHVGGDRLPRPAPGSSQAYLATGGFTFSESTRENS